MPSAITPELAAKCELLDVEIRRAATSMRPRKYSVWRAGEDNYKVWCQRDQDEWRDYPVFDTPEEALQFYIEGNGKWM